MKFQTQLKQNAAHYRKNEIFNLHKDPNVTNISSYCLLHYIQSEYIKSSYYFHYFIWITIAPIVQGIISRDSISASEDSESKIASSIHKRNGKILKHIKQVSASSTSNLSRQKITPIWYKTHIIAGLVKIYHVFISAPLWRTAYGGNENCLKFSMLPIRLYWVGLSSYHA